MMTEPVTAPQIPTTPLASTPSAPSTQATGVATFEDLPPDPAQDGEISSSSGDQPEADYPDFGSMDFETLLAPKAPAQVTTPAQTTPEQPQAPQVPPTVVAPQAPIQPAVPQQPQVPQQAVPPQQSPQAPQQPAVVPPAPQVPAGDPSQVFDSLRQGIERNREAVVNAVAQHYEATISDEDVDLLQTEPKKALAKMAGRVHADGLANIMAVLSQNLPSMVNALMTAQSAQQRATDEFYSKYNFFDRAAHGPTINTIAASVRQMNPQLDAAQFTAMVAAMAAATLRIAPGQQPAAAAPPQAQPPARAPRGFVPAGNGQVPSVPTQQASQGNPWAALAEAALQD